MQVTIKTKNGKEVDVTSIYIMALEGSINRDEYRAKLDEIKNS